MMLDLWLVSQRHLQEHRSVMLDRFEMTSQWAMRVSISPLCWPSQWAWGSAEMWRVVGLGVAAWRSAVPCWPGDECHQTSRETDGRHGRRWRTRREALQDHCLMEWVETERSEVWEEINCTKDQQVHSHDAFHRQTFQFLHQLLSVYSWQKHLTHCWYKILIRAALMCQTGDDVKV